MIQVRGRKGRGGEERESRGTQGKGGQRRGASSQYSEFIKNLKYSLPPSLVFVRDVAEAVGAVLRYKQRHSEGFDRSVPPTVIEDAACPVDVVDIVSVLARPPHIEIRQLEVVIVHLRMRPSELGCDSALFHVDVDGLPQTADTL